MFNLETLSVICSLLQIVGLGAIAGFMTFPKLKAFCVVVGIGGFAAVVRAFLPLEGCQTDFSLFASACGLGIVIMSIVRAQVD